MPKGQKFIDPTAPVKQQIKRRIIRGKVKALQNGWGPDLVYREEGEVFDYEGPAGKWIAEVDVVVLQEAEAPNPSRGPSMTYAERLELALAARAEQLAQAKLALLDSGATIEAIEAMSESEILSVIAEPAEVEEATSDEVVEQAPAEAGGWDD